MVLILPSAFSDSNDKTSQSFFGFFDNTGKGFLGFLHGVTRIVATMSATFAGFLTWVGNGVYQVGRVFANLVIGIGNLIKTVVNNISSAIQNILNSAIDKVNGVIESVNSVLAHTPLEVQIKTIARISNFATDYQQSQYLGISGDTLMSNIASYIPYTVGLSDNYFGTVTNRQNPQKATADLTQALNNSTQAVSDNTKGEKEKDKKGKGDKRGQNSDKPLLKDNVAKAILWGANELGINPNYLASIISFETGGTFSTNARNPKSSGTGLIQFMDYADGKSDGRYYGMTRNQFGALSHMEQMPYVVKYFREKGLKKGASLGDVYDAVTGYGYKKGTKAYELNKVWDTNQNGVIEKGESVKSGAFKAHTKDYFGKNVDLQDLGDAQTDMAKIAEKQKKILDNLAKKLQSPVQKIIQEKDVMLGELEKVLSKDDALYQQYKSQIEKASEFEIYNYSKSVKDEIDNVNDYRISEEQKITQKFADMRAEFDLNPKFSFWSDENKAKYKQAIDKAEQYSLEQYRLTLAEKTAGLFDYQKTELQLINEKYDLEAQKIRLNGENKELQDLQLVDNEGKRKKEIADKQKSARENYDAFNAEINGTKEQYDLAKQFDNRLEIIKEALNAQIIVLDEFNNKKLKLEQDYNIASQRLQLSQYASVADNVANIGKMMLGENSRTYKALFAMNQSFVIAQSGINMYKAISDAWATGATLPQKIAGAMTASSELVKIISAVQSVKMQGFKTGGYTGNVGINDVAGVVHGQEYVLNANATKRLGVDNLNRLNRGDTIGTGQVINVNVTVNSDGTSSVDSQVQIGKQMGEAIKAAVQQELRRERMQGGVLYGR